MREHMIGRNRGRFLVAPLLVVAATAVLFQAQSGAPTLCYAVTAYWIWQTHHDSRQNQRILSFVGGAYRAPLCYAARLPSPPSSHCGEDSSAPSNARNPSASTEPAPSKPPSGS